ncbi:MAG TPA: chloride channel protein [Gemmataceae bacterium]|nr:chloride channel protein [Gemmataceae bacterium]
MTERGDFTANVRLLWIAALAVIIGVLCAFVAYALLWLINFFTALFFYQRLALHLDPEHLTRPADNTLGWLVILVPALGGLIIGLMARFGSERIRGHGIPEAIEAILIGRSQMSPRVAILKPLSSAISIGSGGPFGAEGPIIMTGGAVGSIIAQAFRLTAAERKTLLVVGAAGGMSATFATPFAAVLLAVELLLFEWKPRSFIPVALASAAAALIRPFLLGPGPLFDVTPHAPLGLAALLSSAGCGLLAGLLALFLTVAVYATEDLFHRLPIHWMWWPALGGLVVGVGGWFQPRALGVGYDLIEDLLRGHYALMALLPLILVKCWIWATSLGSGTSGGVLAPLLIMGGALGALESYFLPGGDRTLWPLVSMAAVLGGTMRSPLTGAIFALELTQDVHALPALLIGSVVAHGFTVLAMKRSILTEKVARRGYHVSREYTVDPLERLSVAEVMTPGVVTIPASLPVRELLTGYFLGGPGQRHQGYPVVDASGNLLGVVTRTNLLEEWIVRALAGPADGVAEGPIIAYDLILREPIVVYPWESCRTAAERMAEAKVGRLPVVEPADPRKVIGIVTRSDLLKPRARSVEEEMRRERALAARRQAAAAGVPGPPP